MYCGLISIRTLSNRFISNLYDLEYDKSCFIYNKQALLIDLLPSTDAIVERELEEVLREKGALSNYRPYLGDKTNLLKIIELFVKDSKKSNEIPSLLEQTLHPSQGISFHNQIVSMLYDKDSSLEDSTYRYINEPIPIVPQCFGTATVINDRALPEEFTRWDLINLFITYPDLPSLRSQRSHQHVVSSLIESSNNLLDSFRSSTDLPLDQQRAMIRRLRHSYNLAKSLYKIEIPLAHDPEVSDDRVKIVTKTGAFRSTLKDLSAFVSALKEKLEQHKDTKLQINRLIELIDAVFKYFELPSIGQIKSNYSQKILCVTNDTNLSFNYEGGSDRDRSVVRIPLSGEGLELLTRNELEYLIKAIEDQIMIPNGHPLNKINIYDHLRHLIVDRLKTFQ